MGKRGPSADPERARTVRVETKWRKGEYAQLVANAKAAGLDVSKYIRRSCLE